MKKLMALVLSLGLVLLGTAPVMAAGQVIPSNGRYTVDALPITGSGKTSSSNLGMSVASEPPIITQLNDETLLEVVGSDQNFSNKFDPGKHTGGGGGAGTAVAIGTAFALGFAAKAGADAWDFTKKEVVRAVKWVGRHLWQHPRTHRSY